MIAVGTLVGRVASFGAVAGLVLLVALLVWLIGLLIVLRGSTPGERAEIIRAYATCHPFASGELRRARSCLHGGPMDRDRPTAAKDE